MAIRSLLPIVLVLLLSACGEPESPEGDSARRLLSEQLAITDHAGYTRALQPRQFRFPDDHGPHPEFRNEWWYLTGNLVAADGRRFGYQLTFFRIALAPEMPQRASRWATRQVWMAHFAISDASRGRHLVSERFARGALGLAGAQAAPFRVWLEDWSLSGDEADWKLAAKTEEIGLEITLKPLKKHILNGELGLSQKSAGEGNASYYYSLSRLVTGGQLSIDGEELTVTGLSWLDREWSTSALAANQAGWDWFALQFDDGRDLMFYRLRRTDGSVDPHSAGTLVETDGSARTLKQEEVRAEPVRWWQSEEGSRYPVAWILQLPGVPRLRVEAVFDDQRMDTLVRYWEGMVEVFDAESGAIVGRGYLELAGYEP